MLDLLLTETAEAVRGFLQVILPSLAEDSREGQPSS